ncbi:MAG TPA: peptidylprolyl isomerase [Acidobacteriaceae bacterium]|jgi:hypothetical protein|nr:peptidylprolyl isomerase [Acidobacteriaceae bacterium]
MEADLKFDRVMQASGTAALAFLAIVVCCPSSLSAQEKTSISNPQTEASAKGPSSVLDRVVAIVNGELILDSDVDEERRFNAFEPYSDSSAGFSRDKAIERLINRELILQQIKLQPEVQVSDADVTKQINQLRKTIPACKQYGCETKSGWNRFLADRGFTEATLFARWKQRMEILQFIEERFRMGINITPEEIKNYYDKTMLPEYASRHVAPPKLETISSHIQEVLLQEQVTSLLNDWLKSLRAQGSVVVLHPGEEAP